MEQYRSAAYVLLNRLAEESVTLAYDVTNPSLDRGKESVLQHRQTKRLITKVSDDLNAIIDEAEHFGFVDNFVAKQFSDYVNYNREMLVDLLESRLKLKENDPCYTLLVIAKKKIEDGDIREETQDIKSNIRRTRPKTINYFVE